jgi:hypothetical protein
MACRVQANAAASVRDIAMNTYETLVTRDENMKPLSQLAQPVDVDPASKVFIFKRRRCVHCHNGKPFTSADPCVGPSGAPGTLPRNNVMAIVPLII